MTTIADAAWLATALLHTENIYAGDFSVQDIIQKATREKLVAQFSPGLQVHVSKHCVANKSPNPTPHRMLFETARGRRRLFKEGDTFHPDRVSGKIHPDRADLPVAYQPLLDWYCDVYSKQSAYLTPVAAAAGIAAPHQFTPVAAPFAGFEGMRSTTSYIGPGGTVVLPESVRQELRLKEGSCLSIYRDKNRVVLLPITDEFIRSLRGSLKGDYSLIEDREREHRIEKRP